MPSVLKTAIKSAYFCSKQCAEEFKKNPKKYLSKLKKA
jgi:YHS domain-containing protein